jgi:energy-converting hydrogenase Eha subunit H
VAVHRQLLRKYAALELDSAEDKKKISLRDERISQVRVVRHYVCSLTTLAQKTVCDVFDWKAHRF